MMRIKVKISRADLKNNTLQKSVKHKLRDTCKFDEGNSALVNNFIYNMLLKERNKK